jgi:hypothetical protein
MFDLLDEINFLLYLFFIITIPLFSLPMIFAVISLFKRKWWRSSMIGLGYFFAFLFGKIISFEESFMMFFIVYTFFFLSNFIQGSILNSLRVIITFSIAVFFFFIIGVLYNTPYGEVTQVGSQLNEKQLFKDIELITNDKLRIISIEVWKNGKHPNITVKTNGKIKHNSKIVMVRAKIKESKDNLSQPFEIQEAIRILLYLKDRTLPYQVEGVYISVSNKWIISSLPQVLISKDEFDELYNNNNVKNLDSQQIVEKLSEIWMAQNAEN